MKLPYYWGYGKILGYSPTSQDLYPLPIFISSDSILFPISPVCALQSCCPRALVPGTSSLPLSVLSPKSGYKKRKTHQRTEPGAILTGTDDDGELEAGRAADLEIGWIKGGIFQLWSFY